MKSNFQIGLFEEIRLSILFIFIIQNQHDYVNYFHYSFRNLYQ